MADSSQAKRSPELYIDQQWDRAIDLTVRRVVYGALAGGVVAVLLAREPSFPIHAPLLICLTVDRSDQIRSDEHAHE